MDHQINTEDDRVIGFAEFGDPSGVPVLSCHGAPGCRLAPKHYAEDGAASGFRLIGIARPGYGISSPLPGRSVVDWTRDALAVANHLQLEQLVLQSTSTGGSYSLATASVAADRVIGVLVCCGMTDMHWANGIAEARMECALPIWESADRDAAIAVAIDQFGAPGEKRLIPNNAALFALPPASFKPKTRRIR